MIKLNNIKVKTVYHPNVFFTGDELEGMDIVVGIDYKVDKDTFDITKYAIDKEDLECESLEEIVASFMLVHLEGETYKKLDEINYNELDYRIVSDDFREVDDTEQEFSEEEKKKTYKLIKEFVSTAEFKKEIDRLKEYEAKRLAKKH